MYKTIVLFLNFGIHIINRPMLLSTRNLDEIGSFLKGKILTRPKIIKFHNSWASI